MSNAIVYFSAELLDATAAAFVAAHASSFTGDVHDDAFELVYAIGAPTFALAPDVAGGNVEVDVGVAVTVYAWIDGKRGPQIAAVTVQVQAVATLALTDGVVVISGLTVRVIGAGVPGAAAALFAQAGLPAIGAALARLPLPQLAGVFGLAVTFDRLRIASGVVWIEATLGDGHGPLPALQVEAPPPGYQPGAVVGAISGEVVGALAATKLPITRARSSSHVVLGEGYDFEVFVTAESVALSIAGGVATGDLACRAGVRGHTVVVGKHVPLPAISFHISHTHVTTVIAGAGAKVTVGVELPDPIEVVAAGAPGLIADLLSGEVGTAAQQVTDAVNHALASLFTAFHLPPSVTAFGVEADLSFAWVGTTADAVAAVLVVTPVAPAPPT